LSSYLKTGYFSFDYDVPSYVAESGEFNVSLGYHSGFTGIVEKAITGVTIMNPGSGYVIPPKLVISGGSGSYNSNASISLGVNVSGEVTGATILDCGSGHGNIIAQTLYQTISKFEIVSSGSGYFSDPLISVNAPLGDVFSGANTGDGTIVSSTEDGKLNSVRLYDGFNPTGYINQPTVTLTENVSGVKLISPGTGYHTTPVFSFSGGGGAHASGSGLLGKIVTGLNIVAVGSGYTGRAPEVYFNGENVGGFSIPRFSGMMNSGTLTGFHPITWGGGWVEDPEVILASPEHDEVGVIKAKASALTSNQVTGFEMISHGHGYASAPGLIESHGDGKYEVVMSQGAEVKAVLSQGLILQLETGDFLKSFSGTWDVITGDFSDNWSGSYQNTSLYGDFKYFNPTGIIVSTGLSVVPITVKHYTSSFDSIESVAVLNFSGSGISPRDIYITGVR